MKCQFYLPFTTLWFIIKLVRPVLKNILALFVSAPLALAAAPLCSACHNKNSPALHRATGSSADAHACCAGKTARITATQAHELCQNCFIEAAFDTGTIIKEPAGELQPVAVFQSAQEIIPDVIKHKSSSVEQFANTAPPPLYLLQQKILV